MLLSKRIIPNLLDLYIKKNSCREVNVPDYKIKSMIQAPLRMNRYSLDLSRCKACGFIAKNGFGLNVHLRTCQKKNSY